MTGGRTEAKESFSTIAIKPTIFKTFLRYGKDLLDCNYLMKNL